MPQSGPEPGPQSARCAGHGFWRARRMACTAAVDTAAARKAAAGIFAGRPLIAPARAFAVPVLGTRTAAFQREPLPAYQGHPCIGRQKGRWPPVCAEGMPPLPDSAPPGYVRFLTRRRRPLQYSGQRRLCLLLVRLWHNREQILSAAPDRPGWTRPVRQRYV